MRIPLHTVARLWVVLLSFITLMACTKPEPLAIGLHPWPGYESLYLAETFGWLPEGVRLHRSANASGILDALRAGDIDGAALTLDEVLTARSERIPLTVIMIMNISVGSDDALRRIAAWRNFQVNEIAQSFAGLELPSVAGNRHLLAPQGELLRAARQLNELMVTIGLLAQADSLNHLVDQRYLPRDTRQ